MRNLDYLSIVGCEEEHEIWTGDAFNCKVPFTIKIVDDGVHNLSLQMVLNRLHHSDNQMKLPVGNKLMWMYVGIVLDQMNLTMVLTT